MVSLGGFTLGALVAFGVLAVQAAGVAGAESRATARAAATVQYIDFDDRGVPEMFYLDWSDGRNDHQTMIQADSEHFVQGSVLPIRYDPAEPGGLVFPAEHEDVPLLGTCSGGLRSSSWGSTGSGSFWCWAGFCSTAGRRRQPRCGGRPGDWS
ncbi:hypothetical protein ACIBI9_14865 [Nonomuraea sp. NPDC050451]|uniref:hypothetical protein n=1 Tax=Nonomuraea sp. NPDC050451 TaxID=3364364 RepID=UPI0037A0C11B